MSHHDAIGLIQSRTMSIRYYGRHKATDVSFLWKETLVLAVGNSRVPSCDCAVAFVHANLSYRGVE